MKITTAERIMNRIVADRGCTSIGLLSADLRLSVATVRKHVKALRAAGRACGGWDGVSIEATASERLDRAQDAAVKKHAGTAFAIPAHLLR